jgi:hypothetical protein
MLHRDPDRRPKDLLVLTELIRGCLEKIERRRSLSDRYGIPLKTTVARQTKAPPRRLLRTAVAFGLLLALAAAVAPMLFPDSIAKILGLTHEPKAVGVMIGIPESSPPPKAQVAQNRLPVAPAVLASRPINPTVAPETQAPENTQPPQNPPGIRPADVQQAQIANAQPDAAATTDSTQNSAEATLNSSPSADTASNPSDQANIETPPAAATESRSEDTQKRVTSSSRAPRTGQTSKNTSRGRRGSMRSHFVGITSDGRLILRLPSGRTRIVAPDEDVAPRHRNRVLIDRDQAFGPPPGFGPDYFPND